MVITKSLSKGNVQISEHFRLAEFKCPNIDTVKYDTTILSLLEKVRTHFGCTIQITSGYRTVAENNRVGGSLNSGHLTGQGADFKCIKDGKVISAKYVCVYIEEVQKWPCGIGYMTTATHIDSKFRLSRIDETAKGGYYYLNQHNITFSKYFGFPQKYEGKLPAYTVNEDKGFSAGIALWQAFLCWWGQDVRIDGKFGDDTGDKTEIFQRAMGLKPDRSAGPITLAAAAAVRK
jgi:hypothetical protein